jgi:hypothetical protein
MARGPVIKNYAYRLDHDTGFAPHVAANVCTLFGCKTRSVEVWARPGSWVVGIGGNGTGKPDLLIYAMEVESNPTVSELRRRSPDLTRYLGGRKISRLAKVLVSRRFYYFGDNAILLPSELRQGLTIGGRGCRRVSRDYIDGLISYLEMMNLPIGRHGDPNNPTLRSPTRCGCSSGVSEPDPLFVGMRGIDGVQP